MPDLSRLWQQLYQPGNARLGLGLAGLIIVVDQITKWLVLNVLRLSPPGCLDFQLASGSERMLLPNTCERIEISGIFDLTMVWNKGVSFGLFGADNLAGRLVLILFSIAVAGYLVAGLFGHGALRPERRLQVIAFGMIIGGALGNVVDRILFGAVVDFFDFSGLMFPWVFNIADVSINIGVGLILLDMILDARTGRAT